MSEIEELQAKHTALVDSMRNLRADLTASRMLDDALLIAMTGPMRQAVAANVRQIGEQWIAGALAHSTDPTDKTVHAVQRSVDHLLARLKELPHS